MSIIIMVKQMIIKTTLFSLFSLIELFILTKLMGYRQVTQLSMYDYVIGITIGSIASEMAVLSDFKDLIRPVIAMIIYTLFTIMLSLLSRYSLTLRHLIEGNPLTLYHHDKLDNKALKKAKIDINELLMQLRIQGYFDLTQIDQIILETNGNISISPKTKYRPTQLNDLNKEYQQEQPQITLIINGQILNKNLHIIHKDKQWLEREIKVQGYKLKDITLALYNNNHLTIYN